MQEFKYAISHIDPQGYETVVARSLYLKAAISRVRNLMRAIGHMKPRKYVWRHMPRVHGQETDFECGNHSIIVFATFSDDYVNSPLFRFQVEASTMNLSNFTTSVDYNRGVLQQFAKGIGLEYKGQKGQPRRARKLINDAAVYYAQQVKRSRRGQATD